MSLSRMYKGCSASFVVSLKKNGETPDITRDDVTCSIGKGEHQVILLGDVLSYGKLGKAVFNSIIKAPVGTHKYTILWTHGQDTHMVETGYVEVADV